MRNVQKSLVSVSRICDVGHHVVFLNDGGYIEHEMTRQSTEFVRGQRVSSEGALRKTFQQAVAMNPESTTDEDVVPSSPFAD